MIKLKKFLLLDFCSEKNRGDAAMQTGLLKLVYRCFTDPSVCVVSVFGANQTRHLKNQYDHTIKYPVILMGGLKPTFYPLDGSGNESIFSIELKQALYFCINLFFLFLLFIKIPLPVIRKIIPKAFYTTLEHIRDADLVVWNGRNFRSRNNHLIELFRTINFIYAKQNSPQPREN